MFPCRPCLVAHHHRCSQGWVAELFSSSLPFWALWPSERSDLSWVALSSWEPVQLLLVFLPLLMYLGFLEFLACFASKAQQVVLQAYFAMKAQVLQAYFAPKAQVLQEQVLFLLQQLVILEQELRLRREL